MGKKQVNTAASKDQRKTQVNLYLQPHKYIKINIFLLTLIVMLLLGTEFISSPSRNIANPAIDQKQLLKQKIEQSRRNLADIEKSCPMVMEDHESCKQKLEQCHKTDQEFKQANEEMTGAIKECEAVNVENMKLNEDINANILKMDETLRKLE